MGVVSFYIIMSLQLTDKRMQTRQSIGCMDSSISLFMYCSNHHPSSFTNNNHWFDSLSALHFRDYFCSRKKTIIHHYGLFRCRLLSVSFCWIQYLHSWVYCMTYILDYFRRGWCHWRYIVRFFSKKESRNWTIISANKILYQDSISFSHGSR